MSWYVACYGMLVQSAVAGLLLLSAAWAGVLLLREPARRIRLIELTLAALVALPFVALIPGYPRFSILPAIDESRLTNIAEPTIAAPTGDLPADAELAASELPSTLPSPALYARPSAEPLSLPVREGIPSEPDTASDQREELSLVPRAVTVERPETQADEARSTLRAEPPFVNASPMRDFRFWIVAAYLVGGAAMLLWSAVGWIAVRRLLRSARPADGEMQRLFREIAGPSGGRVALLVSRRASQPCAFAWRGTKIVLPEDFCGTKEAQRQRLRWALAHEWSHVERGDVWTWAFCSLVRAFYFYQPLLWWLRRQLQLSQDYLADARAAGLGAAPEDYAEFLTSAAATFTRPPLSAGLGIGGRTSDLRRRIIMLVENRRPLESASPRKWNLDRGSVCRSRRVRARASRDHRSGTCGRRGLASGRHRRRGQSVRCAGRSQRQPN